MVKRRSKSDVLKDEFYAHEALDRAHLVSHFFFEFIQEHPFVEARPELRAAAEEIGNKLGDFYQLVGRIRYEIGEPTRRKRSSH